MKLYYQVKSNGKCGCSHYNWYITEAFNTKAALKKAKRDYTGTRVIKAVLTEEQVMELPETAKNRILDEAF